MSNGGLHSAKDKITESTPKTEKAPEINSSTDLKKSEEAIEDDKLENIDLVESKSRETTAG